MRIFRHGSWGPERLLIHSTWWYSESNCTGRETTLWAGVWTTWSPEIPSSLSYLLTLWSVTWYFFYVRKMYASQLLCFKPPFWCLCRNPHLKYSLKESSFQAMKVESCICWRTCWKLLIQGWRAGGCIWLQPANTCRKRITTTFCMSYNNLWRWEWLPISFREMLNIVSLFFAYCSVNLHDAQVYNFQSWKADRKPEAGWCLPAVYFCHWSAHCSSLSIALEKALAALLEHFSRDKD